MKKLLVKVSILAALFLLNTSVFAQTKIFWWHAMDGRLGEKVKEIAATYNKSQSKYEVVPIYKGSYSETMTQAIAAFRAKEQPHIVQVFEVGTATMMAAKGAIYPVYQMMKDAGKKFNPKDYLAAVTGYYTDTAGNMLSMPFNSSTPILYYNKEAFKKAGLDANKPPKTWEDLEAAAKKLLKAGYKCGFTTGWQSWVQLENFSAWHNIPFASNSNGFGGTDVKLLINNPTVVKHISKMQEWQKSGIFSYGGRRSDSASKFYTGECAMYMNSSAALAGVKSNTKFEFGVGMLPYWSDVKSAPQNSIIGGATLWALKGHKKSDYEGVADFFSFVSSATNQADWHQFTGYLPITYAAFELSKKQNYYKENPGADIGILQMTGKAPTANSKGLRLGNFVQIRDVINEELEAVWSQEKSAKEALDNAVKRSNVLLKKFARTAK